MSETNYKNLTLTELYSALQEKKNTLILFHARPDADAAGSAFALRMILEALGSRGWCVCDGILPDRLKFLAEPMQNVTSEGDIPSDFEIERIVSVDTASPAQLGGLEEKYSSKVDLMIDHHGKGVRYADGLVIPDAAATGEIIFDLARYAMSQGIKLPIAELDMRIYAAVSSDTGGFRYASVTPETHRRAAEMISSGIDAAEINRLLFDSKPYIQLKAEQLAFERLTIYDGDIAIIEFPYELKVKHGIENQHTETLIDVARTVSGVKVAAAIRQPEDNGKFRCSMRSNCDFDVSAVCAEFGGGGHKAAAGCTIEADGIHDAAMRVLEAVRKMR